MMPSKDRLKQMLSKEGMADIDNWIHKYPEEERQSAIMSTLRIVQEEKGHLSQEAIEAVADYLQMPVIAALEVATFYSMYRLKPCGKNVLQLCTNISCMLQGSEQIAKHLENQLGIQMGQTTPDGLFTLKSVECLGACVKGPVIDLNKTYYECMTESKVDELLDACRVREE